MSGVALNLPDELIDEIAKRVADRLEVQTSWRDVEGVARAFETTPRQVRQWREKGWPAKRIGKRLMLDLRAVEDWLASQ